MCTLLSGRSSQILNISSRLPTSEISVRTMSNHNKHLRDIFQAAVNSVEPRNLVRNSVSLEGENLRVCGKSFPLQKPCHMVGFGKAVLGMAAEMETLLGYRLTDGVVVVPTGIFATFAGRSDLLPVPDSRLRFIEGAAGNLPDENAMRGARRIKVSLKLNFQVRLGDGARRNS